MVCRHFYSRLIVFVLLQLLAKHAASTSYKPNDPEDPSAAARTTSSSSSSSSSSALRSKKNISRSITETDRTSCGSCCYTIEKTAPYRVQYPKLDIWFYNKVINIDGFLILSSRYASDAALYEAALIFDKLSARRPDFKSTLLSENVVKVVVMADDEVITDVPELMLYWDSPQDDWMRGLAATPYAPVTVCAEENLVCYERGDPYKGENICLHEISHTLQGHGVLPTKRTIELNGEEDLDLAIRSVYNSSVLEKGLWNNTYAATNHKEYWAEGVQSFYNVNLDGPATGNGLHNSINTREELRKYDPDLYNIISRVFPSDITFECPPQTCDCNNFQCPRKPAPAPILPKRSPVALPPATSNRQPAPAGSPATSNGN